MREYTHEPVMASECLALLEPKPGAIFVDGTVGLGGHAAMLLASIMPNGVLVGIDRDNLALSNARKKLGTGFLPVHGNFFDMRDILANQGIGLVDGILIDLGVSSYQLDAPERGFSYNVDAPLDMRMDSDAALTAKHVVNLYSEKELTRVIRAYGEERWASRIAKFIVKSRETRAIESTLELVEVILHAIPAAARRTGPHPARRTFQAIRIEVNNELGGLYDAVVDASHLLKPDGKICVITFHSLEDRIVKTAFANLQNPCTCPPKSPVCNCGKRPVTKTITKSPLVPSSEEIERNSRARSAKVRAAARLSF